MSEESDASPSNKWRLVAELRKQLPQAFVLSKNALAIDPNNQKAWYENVVTTYCEANLDKHYWPEANRVASLAHARFPLNPDIASLLNNYVKRGLNKYSPNKESGQ
jgi:hypothetical protein